LFIRSLQPSLAEVGDDSLGHRAREREHPGIVLQGERGIDSEEIRARGPGLVLPPQAEIGDGHVDVGRVCVWLPLEGFLALFDRFLILPRVAISDG
jgi:hypothetical protein